MGVVCQQGLNRAEPRVPAGDRLTFTSQPGASVSRSPRGGCWGLRTVQACSLPSPVPSPPSPSPAGDPEPTPHGTESLAGVPSRQCHPSTCTTRLPSWLSLPGPFPSPEPHLTTPVPTCAHLSPTCALPEPRPSPGALFLLPTSLQLPLVLPASLGLHSLRTHISSEVL